MASTLLAAVAVTAIPAPAGAVDLADASITIVHDAHDARDFSYTATGPGLTAFTLDDDTAPDLPGSVTFTGLSAGTYAVAQDLVPGWTLGAITCTGAETVDLPSRAVTIALSAGEQLTCTFTAAEDHVQVGAIRWDAWNDGPPGQAVEYTLGPEQWRSRLPWFGEVTGPDTIIARADNQETADAEIQLAASLGIDYFAFVWYTPGTPVGSEDEAMSRGLHLYRSSANRDLVKYTVAAQPRILDDAAQRALLLEYMRDPNWVRVKGRPLVFVGMAGTPLRASMDAFRAESKAQGTGDPFVAYIMTKAGQYDGANAVVDRVGYDALATYATGVSASAGEPYSLLASRAHATWDLLATTGRVTIPGLMAGWDPRPRLERPPYWGDSGSNWYQPATTEELAAHFADGRQWARAHGSPAVLAYAWNEYDEGGWLGPAAGDAPDRLDALQTELARATGPAVSVQDLTGRETALAHSSARVTVSLSSTSTEPVTVTYATADDTATAPADYTAVSGSVTIEPGATKATISIPVHNDTLDESNEQLSVVLGEATNGVILRSTARVTIDDDDGPPAPTYLSDLEPTSWTNGSGPYERDRSNGWAPAGDGSTITLNGVTSDKGLGTHSNSTLAYAVTADAATFDAELGVDDECGPSGSVVFKVYVNGTLRYTSPKMYASTATQKISINVAGASSVLLKVTNASDGYACDHADWANARFSPPGAAIVTTTTSTVPPSTSTTTTLPPTTTTLPPVTTTTTLPPTSTTTTTEPVDPPTTTTTTEPVTTTTSPDPPTTTTEPVTTTTTTTTLPPTTTAPPTTPTTTTTAPPTTTTTAPAPTTTTTAPAPTTTTTAPVLWSVWLSDLTPTAATNGYGPYERDMSNGNAAAGDGRTITLNGVTSAKGLGVHAASTITYAVVPGATRFVASVGVDDECVSLGSVVFQVKVDGVSRFKSTKLRPTSPSPDVSVDVTGASTIDLVVSNAGDGSSCDHADWAAARFDSTQPPTSTTTTTSTVPPTSTTTTSTTVPPTPTTTAAPTTTTTEAGDAEVIPTTTTTVEPVVTTTTTTLPPLPGPVWLSDLTPTAATNGYGPYERDMSNGNAAAGDGRTITLNGVTSAKGLGVHATSELTFPVVPGATRFAANLGIDDECVSLGSVVFQIQVDGATRYRSTKHRATSATTAVLIDVAGASNLTLKVTNGGDGSSCDHADWANARFL